MVRFSGPPPTATRNQPISSALKQVLEIAASATGVDEIVIKSGGQPAIGRRTGSHRHDNGRAADIQLSKQGRVLTFSDKTADSLVVEFISAAAAAGATGIGAGVTYMGNKTIHVGFGTSPNDLRHLVWGAGGNSSTAPSWLVSAAHDGWRRSSPHVGVSTAGGATSRAVAAGALRTQRPEPWPPSDTPLPIDASASDLSPSTSYWGTIMPNKSDISWFKEQFGQRITLALRATPFDLDMLVALACQETGEIWPRLRGRLPVGRVLALCVGDVINYSGPHEGRQDFPHNKAALLAEPHGQAMYELARQTLVDMAKYIPEYKMYAADPERFCHGYGVFQRDIQFFKTKPDFFLQRKYELLEDSLIECLEELDRALGTLCYRGKDHLSDTEFCYVAIAYNTGGFDHKRELRQGYRDSSGRYYGENVYDFIKASRAVPMQAAAAEEKTSSGLFTIVARSGLKLRNGPGVDFQASQTLPAGMEVHVVGFDGPDRQWARVALHPDGLVDGHVLAVFLKKSDGTGDGQGGEDEPI